MHDFRGAAAAISFHVEIPNELCDVPISPKSGSFAVSSFSYIGLPGLPGNMHVTHIVYERITLAAPQGNLLSCLSCLSLGTKHDKMDQMGSTCTKQIQTIMILIHRCFPSPSKSNRFHLRKLVVLSQMWTTSIIPSLHHYIVTSHGSGNMMQQGGSCAPGSLRCHLVGNLNPMATLTACYILTQQHGDVRLKSVNSWHRHDARRGL